MKKFLIVYALVFANVSVFANDEVNPFVALGQVSVTCAPGLILAPLNILGKLLPFTGFVTDAAPDLLDGHYNQEKIQIQDKEYGILGYAAADAILKMAGDDSDSELSEAVDRIVSLDQAKTFTPCKKAQDKLGEAFDD